MTYLRNQTISPNQKCRVVDISNFYLQSKLPPNFQDIQGLEFLINPVELNRSLSAQYSEQVGIGSQQKYLQYISSSRDSISLPGCLVDARCKNLDLQQYLDAFEQLLYLGSNTHPKILAVCFAQRVIQPVVLINLQIRESNWSNGFLSSGTFDLEFKYIQPPIKEPRVSSEPKKTEREKKNEAKKK